jgi:hypothetical protein
MMASFVAGLVNPRFGATRLFHVRIEQWKSELVNAATLSAAINWAKFVGIDRDGEDTGGYFVLTVLQPDITGRFDTWAEGKETLRQRFVRRAGSSNGCRGYVLRPTPAKMRILPFGKLDMRRPTSDEVAAAIASPAQQRSVVPRKTLMPKAKQAERTLARTNGSAPQHRGSGAVQLRQEIVLSLLRGGLQPK